MLCLVSLSEKLSSKMPGTTKTGRGERRPCIAQGKLGEQRKGKGPGTLGPAPVDAPRRDERGRDGSKEQVEVGRRRCGVEGIPTRAPGGARRRGLARVGINRRDQTGIPRQGGAEEEQEELYTGDVSVKGRCDSPGARVCVVDQYAILSCLRAFIQSSHPHVNQLLLSTLSHFLLLSCRSFSDMMHMRRNSIPPQSEPDPTSGDAEQQPRAPNHQTSVKPQIESNVRKLAGV
jgi:hypothetical protein